MSSFLERRVREEQDGWTSVVAVGLSDEERHLLTTFAGEIGFDRGVRLLIATTVDGGLNRVAILRGHRKSCVGLISARLGAREVVRFVRWFATSDGLAPVVVLGGRGDEETFAQALAARACDVLLRHELDVDRLLRSLRIARELARRDLVEAAAEERWKESEALLDTVWDTVEEGLLLVDEQHRVQRFNGPAADLLDRPERPILGAPFGALGWAPAENTDLAANRFASTELLTEVEGASGEREKVGVRVRPVERSRSGGRDRGRLVFVRRRGESQEIRATLSEARHFAGLGRFVAGAAHDGSNLLTPLMGYSELLLAKLPPDSNLVHYAEEIQRSARLATELLRRLRDRGQSQPMPDRPVVADQSLVELAGLLQSLVGRNIEVSHDLQAGSLAVATRGGEIEQIVLNLAANARDAMALGGRLMLRTRNEGDTRWVLEIEDTGAGIPRENLSRIFEPSFTTKALGKGTGLGLWIVRSIVDQAGGRVEVRSVPGSGTVVRVELPATSPAESPSEGADLS
ncbi:MAG: ATP-binding protein [Thermoanaerobaculia bacterium]